MPTSLMGSVYALLIVVGLLAMYTILNAGNPDSLLRSVFPDPALDVYVALASSLTVFVLGFIVFYTRDSREFRNLIQLNGEKVRRLRNEGRTDNDIADSILEAMGSHSGYRHNMAKKKLVIYLAQFK